MVDRSIPITTCNILFFYSEATNVKQWDHPKFVDIRQRLDDCNYVKYSIYRLALKFRVLQSALHSKYSYIINIIDRGFSM